jgi:hypothetical protein
MSTNNNKTIFIGLLSGVTVSNKQIICSAALDVHKSLITGMLLMFPFYR